MSMMEEHVPMSSCSQTGDVEMEEVTRKKKLAVAETEAGLSRKKMRLENKDEDNLSISILCDKLSEAAWETFEELLPSMARTLKSNDWNLPISYIKDPIMIFHNDGTSELVPKLVWLLFAEVSDAVKVGVVCALRMIIYESSKDTNMSTTDQVGFETSASSMSTDVSIDQTTVEGLLQELLRLKDTVVPKQVLFVLPFLNKCHQISFGVAIQDQVIQLFLDNNTRESITPYSVLRAICSIASVCEGMCMKIVETNKECDWLMGFVANTNDELAMQFACWTVAYVINVEMCKDYAIKKFMCGILQWIENHESCRPGIKFAVACAISWATIGASFELIEELVEMGCLRNLFKLAKFMAGMGDVIIPLTGIENILKAGKKMSKVDDDDDDDDEEEEEVEEEHNKYADMVDEFDFDIGWSVLFNKGNYYNRRVYYLAQTILREYSPDWYAHQLCMIDF